MLRRVARGGTLSSVGVCKQVVAPVGPYTGGFTARISKVTPEGIVTTVADKLPSDQTSAAQGSLVSGVADVAFVGNKLYAILAGAGCSHGLAGTHNGVLRVKPDGSTTMVANLSAFQKRHPVANPQPDDFEPDGTWYSMIAVHGDLYAIEPNHGDSMPSRRKEKSAGSWISQTYRVTSSPPRWPSTAMISSSGT